MSLRRVARFLLPFRVRSAFRRAHRELVFRLAMRRFLRNPKACTRPGSPVLRDLIYGWGNESWSALDEYLAACILHASTTRGHSLECGSGLTTLLIGAIAKKRGQRHWALEHEPQWETKVGRYLRRYGIDSVIVCRAPLKDYGGFSWYDPPLQSLPESFSLVVCDGPPASTAGGRYGLVPVMRDWLKPGCVLLLDDANREAELSIARRWDAELGATSKVLGEKKLYIEMVVTAKVPKPQPAVATGRARGAGGA